MRVTAELTAIINAQDGLVTRRQVLDAGLSDTALRHAVSGAKSWQRLARGLYATFTGALNERQALRAALLYAGPDAAITGSWACRAYDLRYAPRQLIVEVLVPHHVIKAATDLASIKRTRKMPHVRVIAGLPCVDPVRAVLDAVHSSTNLRAIRAALCEVVQRGLATTEELVAICNAAGVRHALINRVLSDLGAGCMSAPECETRDLMRTSEVLPEFTWNQSLPGTNGELVPDAYDFRSRLVLEIDSVEWHQLGDGPERTERKRSHYAACGWRVLPIVPRRLRNEPVAVLAEIETAYLAGFYDMG